MNVLPFFDTPPSVQLHLKFFFNIVSTYDVDFFPKFDHKYLQ